MNPVLLAYVKAMRAFQEATAVAADAEMLADTANQNMQAAWREVKHLLNSGELPSGIHAVDKGEALLVDLSVDYPDLIPFFQS